jgi:hypothetical protein
MCNVSHRVCSESSEHREVDVNSAAVAGITSIGLGHANLSQFSSMLNMPSSMSQNAYKKIEGDMMTKFYDSLSHLITEAGKEEEKIARERSDIDLVDGKAIITVIADGAWSRRSNKSLYNANSGVAAIIGKNTGKILYIGVKNKYCSVCALQKEDSTPHTCHKNYNGTSTAMESEILVEGFLKSVSVHNLKYKYLVADGDSSTFKKILDAKPYGPDFYVEKIECKNHLLRNFCNKLKDLASKRYSSSGKVVPVKIRAQLKNNIQRLRTGVDCAVKHYRCADMPNTQKLSALKKDIENGIYHVFGDHQNCASYFCKKEVSDTSNSITLMRECGVLDDISTYTNKLKFHAKSLLLHFTNNPVESFNSVVAKFVGGKRVNHTKRVGYELRCVAAAISYNSQGNYVRNISRKLGGSEIEQLFIKI